MRSPFVPYDEDIAALFADLGIPALPIAVYGDLRGWEQNAYYQAVGQAQDILEGMVDNPDADWDKIEQYYTILEKQTGVFYWSTERVYYI